MGQKRGLGRGLEALFTYSEEEYEKARGGLSVADLEVSGATTTELPLDKIIANPDQPRKVFNDVAMSDLVSSVRVHGVITPIVVVKQGEHFMIIAGERRFRASKKAGLKNIPAVVREYTPQQVKELSLIENLQREDLNPIETANALRQLMDEFNLTQEVVADRVGKSRSAVANTLRLLTLSNPIMELVAEGRLSEGHARCLCNHRLTEAVQCSLASEALDGKMTVREFEARVKAYFAPPPPTQPPKPALPPQSIELRDLVDRMRRVFGTKVSVIGGDNKGRLVIDYFTRDDLDRVAEFVEILEGIAKKA
ncbi:MAG: ParB/RepB/Spo0J family partition protein [Firmicutes bacterium]|nr:ParB/RepB/Spo0J family partition protein [Bacillota bacterium]